MALNTIGKGVAIARLGKQPIYVSEQPLEDGSPLLKAKNGDKFQQIPNKKQERSVLFVCAPSGAGKSYYCVQWLKEYRKLFPKNPVFVFSSLEDDETLDVLPYLKRIKIKDDKFLESDLNEKDFVDCCVVFDDIDAISNLKIKKKVYDYLTILLETGRHSRTSVICTSHASCAGHLTKSILREAHSVTVFPRTMGGKSLRYLLDNYFGMSKEEIAAIKKCSGRWATICKTFPMVVITEDEIREIVPG